MYVTRDLNGNIKGVYAQRQPGYAEEEVAVDSVDVVKYRTAPIARDPVTEWLSDLRANPAKLDRLKALTSGAR